jgi:hypothetical protein
MTTPTLSTPVRLTGFVVGIVAILLAGLGIGRAVGPLDPADESDAHGGGGHGGGMAASAPTGLSSTQDGYALQLASPTHPRGRAAAFSFTVTGPDGAPVTDYTTTHEKDLHLIVVRRDASGFQHVHPELEDDGTWSIGLTLPEAGSYKAFADFVPDGGSPLTLAGSFDVDGPLATSPLPAPDRVAEVDDYTVTLDGDLAAGTHGDLTFTVRRDGVPVDDLDPYLGAYGHLVALRASDLAYLHVHPGGEPGDGVTPAGPDVSFAAEVPSDGAYRLYLDFQHEGTVRTAEFTVEAGTSPAGGSGGEGADMHGGGMGADTHDGDDHGH